MNLTDNQEQEKIIVEGTVNLKIPKRVLDFAEFYAEIGGMDIDALLTKIVIERMSEIKEKFKTMPYLEVPELL